MNQEVINLLKNLPKYDEIKHLTINLEETHYILPRASENIQNIQQNYKEKKESLPEEAEECSYLVEALCHHLWESIHIGMFSLVPLPTRQIYTVTCYYKIIYDLFSSTEQPQLEKCSKCLDDGVLIGYHQNISSKCDLFKSDLMKFLDEKLEETSQHIKLVDIDPIEHKTFPCDIPVLYNPSVEDFNTNHFSILKPALLRNTIDNWPAVNKWRDMNYILKICGNRIVPIEIGSYAADDFGQQLMKIREFLQRQFSQESPPDGQVEYLAQHELFDQIPNLKADIICPSYCRLGENQDQIDIKAWLGPKGTISPMHQDPKHNILCQVFGMKHIILASPDDTCFLYPYDTEFLENTSQINAEYIDYERFPLAKQAKFYKLNLQEGECLYIPPKWWHYVRSESKSFSVSFWWK